MIQQAEATLVFQYVQDMIQQAEATLVFQYAQDMIQQAEATLSLGIPVCSRYDTTS